MLVKNVFKYHKILNFTLKLKNIIKNKKYNNAITYNVNKTLQIIIKLKTKTKTYNNIHFN